MSLTPCRRAFAASSAASSLVSARGAQRRYPTLLRCMPRQVQHAYWSSCRRPLPQLGGNEAPLPNAQRTEHRSVRQLHALSNSSGHRSQRAPPTATVAELGGGCSAQCFLLLRAQARPFSLVPPFVVVVAMEIQWKIPCHFGDCSALRNKKCAMALHSNSKSCTFVSQRSSGGVNTFRQ